MKEIIMYGVLALVFLAVGVALRMLDKDASKEKELNDKRDAVTTKALANLVMKMNWIDEAQKEETAERMKAEAELRSKLDALQEKLDKLPVAQFEDEVGRMKAWNDGVDSILSYGPDVPRLNKEGLKHE